MLDVLALAALCVPDIAPLTMDAIVRRESRSLPYSIQINGPWHLSRQPATLEEAVEIAERLHARGLNFDSGLGQLNSANVSQLGASWRQVFTPCTNIQLVARILKACFIRARVTEPNAQRALASALSCYNTGNAVRGFTNGYVQSVYASAAHSPPVRFHTAQASP